jgi:hypothetical protein
VVGTNFVSPTANPKKKDHVGLFIQEKTKGFIKHYAVDRKILNGGHWGREPEEEKGATAQGGRQPTVGLYTDPGSTYFPQRLLRSGAALPCTAWSAKLHAFGGLAPDEACVRTYVFVWIVGSRTIITPSQARGFGTSSRLLGFRLVVWGGVFNVSPKDDYAFDRPVETNMVVSWSQETSAWARRDAMHQKNSLAYVRQCWFYSHRKAKLSRTGQFDPILENGWSRRAMWMYVSRGYE